MEENRPLPLQDWPELELEETLGSDVRDVESGLRFLDGEKNTRESTCCCCCCCMKHESTGQYFSPEGLQLREDLRVDDVELRLDLVAAHVVHGGHVLVEDQVFGGGWKPGKKHL